MTKEDKCGKLINAPERERKEIAEKRKIDKASKMWTYIQPLMCFGVLPNFLKPLG